MNRAELLALPATVDIVTAARAMSCGRTLAYQLVRTGQFPARVVRLGSRYRVVTGGRMASWRRLASTRRLPTPRSPR